MALQHEHWISLEEYHDIERTHEIKYEYADGHIYAMSGGTSQQSQIAINILMLLTAYLRGKGCRAFNSDMKVLPLKQAHNDENPSYFPDVTVTCNPEDYKHDSTAIRSPHLVVEVLSPSTAYRDRGEKLRVYQACPSINEYVMVSSHHQEVEVYHREQDNKWTFTRYIARQDVTLASVGLTIAVNDIYASTDVPVLASVVSTD
jgi:Uma2 family endonuclease